MREIKFRVWSNQLNKMVYPNERGWFDKCFIGKNQFIQSCQLSLAIEKNGKELEVMQYTGLKDRNGTEIYEGDLLTDYGEAPPVYVEYSEEHGAYCFVDKFDPSGTVYYTPLMISYEQMEVIGNIYANPGLLEGTE
jgi:uncharacterized phage protein (TIGR01671 family)